MMDISLLKDPVFLLIGISNVFGMAGLYVPFVYLVDAAVLDVSEISRCTCLHEKLYHVVRFFNTQLFLGNRKQFCVIFAIHNRYYQYRGSCSLWIYRRLSTS